MGLDRIDEVCKKIEDLAKKTPASDIKQNIKATLVKYISNLDLVSREEFDIQTQVLNRTRAQLSVLEKRISGMVDTENTKKS
tara:strand:- start:403 stop:648 length:246 start_codon:yes stop_codon:yes gene_type:complete